MARRAPLSRITESRAMTPVIDLAARRALKQITQALEHRVRYKYVKPRVEREGLGWKVVSPNCSRNVDPEGGEIDIAWLMPLSTGGWLLYACDHAQGCWRLCRQDAALQPLLDHLCADPEREFWQ